MANVLISIVRIQIRQLSDTELINFNVLNLKVFQSLLGCVFNLFILKSQINDLAVLLHSTEL